MSMNQQAYKDVWAVIRSSEAFIREIKRRDEEGLQPIFMGEDLSYYRGLKDGLMKAAAFIAVDGEEVERDAEGRTADDWARMGR